MVCGENAECLVERDRASACRQVSELSAKHRGRHVHWTVGPLAHTVIREDDDPSCARHGVIDGERNSLRPGAAAGW